MSYNIIDSDSIQINDNLNVQIFELGELKHTIIVIDNLLKNPEDLLSIIQSHPIEKNRGDFTDYLGHGHAYHIPVNLRLLQIRKTLAFLGRNYFGVEIEDRDLMSNINLQINLFGGEDSTCNYADLLPHVDPSKVAFSLFLNDDETCKGGTAFYKHFLSGLDYDLRFVDEDFVNTPEYQQIVDTRKDAEDKNLEVEFDSRLLDSDYEWEKQLVLDSAFNRMIIYPSYLFHAPYVETDWYKDVMRVSIAGFLS